MKKIVLAAQINHLDEVLDFINAELESNDVPMKTVMQLDVAVEEIFVNIAHYAYAPNIGDARVTVDIKEEPRCVEITFSDSGKPYNPLLREDPDVTQGVEERQIGGLGIFVVKKTMDQVTYRYENGQNVLSICKML